MRPPTTVDLQTPIVRRGRLGDRDAWSIIHDVLYSGGQVGKAPTAHPHCPARATRLSRLSPDHAWRVYRALFFFRPRRCADPTIETDVSRVLCALSELLVSAPPRWPAGAGATRAAGRNHYPPRPPTPAPSPGRRRPDPSRGPRQSAPSGVSSAKAIPVADSAKRRCRHCRHRSRSRPWRRDPWVGLRRDPVKLGVGPIRGVPPARVCPSFGRHGPPLASRWAHSCLRNSCGERRAPRTSIGGRGRRTRLAAAQGRGGRGACEVRTSRRPLYAKMQVAVQSALSNAVSGLCPLHEGIR